MSGPGIGEGKRNCCGQAVVSGGTSASVFFFVFFFSGAASSLRGAKPHADEQSEKVRRWWAGSVSSSTVLYGSSVKRFSLVFQAPCGLLLELDVHLRRAGVAARRSVGPVTSPKRNSKFFFFLGS